MANILVVTKHYPQDERDPAGVFVERHTRMLNHNTRVVRTNVWDALRKGYRADLVIAHWLWPAGYIGLLVSLIYHIPLVVVLYGDPFMIDRYRWVRVAAWPIIKRARGIQVISTPCQEIMNKWYRKVCDCIPVR